MRTAVFLPVLLAAAGAQAASVDVMVLGRDGKPLPQAVIFLESASAKAASQPMQNVEIEQANKRFSQLVTVVTVGSAVSFPNRDKVRHHVYSFSPTKVFELKLYIGTPESPVVFDKPGIVVLGCNIHDTMAAWVVVVETPHHAQTPSSGRVRLTHVPPGSYRLRSWHPELPVGAPALDQPLVVGALAASTTVRVPVLGKPAL